MRKFALLITFLLLSYNATIAQCTTAYSAASYALAHTKRALKSDNFDHQMQYAARGVEAMEKAQTLIEECGCQPALDQLALGLNNLSRAVEPEDWDAGRYYTKIALAHVQSMMGELDLCTASNTNTEPVTAAPGAIASASNDTEYLADNGNLLSEQQKLEAERKRLEEQQRILEEKIARQQLLAEEARLARARELEEQMIVKQAAEVHLAEMEQNLIDLAETLGCSKVRSLLNGSYKRSDAVLENESLAETKQWYLQQAVRMQKDVAAALEGCR
ncbi:hypothetical protein [Robertkochia sediminum]|uniref:hypothetical protein n=1 Tax=Robertkochia sediminum TaxID=2785326 RepID=UPI001931F69C|nr:hypothetical protein [Robertkochia sediminum]MBL7472270.1 hypothetical protein [Robertkochia sediminum]